MPTQFDDSSGRCDEGHLTGGAVKSGGKNREERPGEVQIRRQETERQNVPFLSVPLNAILTLFREQKKKKKVMELLHNLEVPLKKKSHLYRLPGLLKK